MGLRVGLGARLDLRPGMDGDGGRGCESCRVSRAGKQYGVCSVSTVLRSVRVAETSPSSVGVSASDCDTAGTANVCKLSRSSV